MKAIWGKYSEDKERTRKELDASVYILETLDKILQEKAESSICKTRNPKGYNMPKWEYYIAHQFGYQEALDFVRKLIQTKE